MNALAALRAPLTVAALALALAFSLAGCAARHAPPDGLAPEARWALLPTTGADASSGRSAATLIETHLRARGVRALDPIAGAPEAARERARRAGYRYAVAGDVERWRYAGRLGRTPRIEMRLDVTDLSSGDVAWSGDVRTSGRTGGTLAELAERAVAAVVDDIALAPGAGAGPVPVRAAVRGGARPVPVPARASALDAPAGGAPAAEVPVEDTFPVAAASAGPARAPSRSIAFHYGADLPVGELAMFDRVVVEPDHTDAGELAALGRHGADAYAYLSVGEVGPTRAYGAEVDDAWVLGTNPAWDSRVMDASNPGWTDLLSRRVDALVAAGYDGLFLDTLDSHRMFADTPTELAAQEGALVAFLSRVRERHPDLALIANRGFELLDRAAPHLEAIAGESLYARWDNAAGEYADVPPADRAWLAGQLRRAVREHGLEAIAIDYLPPARRDEAREVARRIAADGFTPWVTTPALDALGVGAIEVMPREVLMLFDGRVTGAQEWSEVHKLAAMPLEYLGYVPVYRDVVAEGLPAGSLAGRVAGIVSWASAPYTVPGVADFVARAVGDGVPVALFGDPGFTVDAGLAAALGVRIGTGLDPRTASVAVQDEMVGFEREPARRLETFGFDVRSVSADNEVHLAYADAKGRRADVVVTGPWGGIAAHPGAVVTELDELYRWVVDPFAFLTRALHLEPIPAPDVTTENGRRLWLAHIDGDALPSWAEVPGGRLGAEEIEERILARWPWPHTISIVEAEMVATPAYIDRRRRMFEVARRLFALPQVDIASHSFSHPYDWPALAADPDAQGLSLPVTGYAYDPEREVGGSIDFIEDKLAPPGKRATTFLWTGNALPGAPALAAVEARGLANLNGGFTSITRATPTVALVDPMVRTVGEHVQVYAPMTNENVFTDDWRGPFDGFRRVIETYRMTDAPRRLKPINVYYHFYAGTKAASLRSLEEVYEWSTAQDVHPVHVAEYAAKVDGFRTARVARSLDGRWTVAGLGDVRSVRLLGEDRSADLDTDAGLVGQRTLHDGTYLHTAGADRVSFRTRADAGAGTATAPYLVAANGRVTRWDDAGGALRLRVRGHVPVTLELGGPGIGACALVTGAGGQRVAAEPTGRDTFTFRFDEDDTGDARLDCPA